MIPFSRNLLLTKTTTNKSGKAANFKFIKEFTYVSALKFLRKFKKILKYRPNKSRPGIDSKNRVTSVVKFCRRGSTRRRGLLKKSAKKKSFHSPLIFTWIISRHKVPIFDFQSQFTTLKNHLNLANYFSVVTYLSLNHLLLRLFVLKSNAKADDSNYTHISFDTARQELLNYRSIFWATEFWTIFGTNEVHFPFNNSANYMILR